MIEERKVSSETKNEDVEGTFTKDFDESMNMISSKDQRLEGLFKMRDLLSNASPMQIYKISNSRFVQRFLDFLRNDDDDDKIRAESLWVLSYIFKTNHQQKNNLISFEDLEVIINVLDSKSELALEPALKAFSEIAKYDKKCVGYFFQQNFPNRLKQIYERFSNNEIIQANVLNTIATLIISGPLSDWELINQVTPLLIQAITLNNNEVTKVSLEALEKVSNKFMTDVVEFGCVPFLINLVLDNDSSRFSAALRVLGNIVSGSPEDAKEAIVHPMFIPRLFELTSYPDEKIQREAIWIVSNIVADSPESRKKISSNPVYMETLKNALFNGGPVVSREAAFAFSNFVASPTVKEMKQLVNQYELVKCLARILEHPDKEIVEIGLESVSNTLRCYEKANRNIIIGQIIQEGILQKVQSIKEELNKNIGESNDNQKKKGKSGELRHIERIESICSGNEPDEGYDMEVEGDYNEYDPDEGIDEEQEENY